MKLLLILSLLCIAPTKLLAYRDGAREDSCYNHTIIHDGALIFECNPPVCPFFLRIREMMNESTLELGNETDTYQCGELYGSKGAHKVYLKHGIIQQTIYINTIDLSSIIFLLKIWYL